MPTSALWKLKLKFEAKSKVQFIYYAYALSANWVDQQEMNIDNTYTLSSDDEIQQK